MDTNKEIDKWIDFHIKTHDMITSKKQLFSKELLEMIDTYFGIKHSIIVVFDNDLFIKSHSHNIPKTLDDSYKEYYFVENYHPHYAKSNWNSLVIGSKLFPEENYDDNYYANYVYEKSGLYYVAAMPFDKFHIAFYKEKQKGDFDKIEIAKLENIYKILKHAYAMLIKETNMNNLYDVSGGILDDLSIGVIVFNENKDVLSYNKIAISQIQDICGHVNVHSLYSDIERKLSLPKDNLSNSKEIEYKNYIINFIYSFNHDNLQRTLSVVIKQKSKAEIDKSFDSLSIRELEIIECLIKGYSYQKTAEQLFISINTVRTHLKNIYKKLDVNNQRTLVYRFLNYKENLNS